MSEFIPINTQEEFDSAIKSRLARERDTVSKQFADYDDLKTSVKNLTDQNNALTQAASEHNEKMKTLQDQLAEANEKISGYQMAAMKTNIAVEKGLPLELRDRLSGATEEELKADAEKLAKLFTMQNNSNIPLANLGTGASDDYSSTGKIDEDRAMRKFVKSLKSINE